MSSFKRLIDLAKSEVGALREKVTEKVHDVSDRVSTGSGRRLENFSDDELSMEIERRRLAKKIKEEEEAKKAAGAASPPATKEPSDGGRAEPPPPEPPPRARRAASSRAPIVSKAIEQYYANLETEVGADLETVKRSYRRLMRKYHPDKHAGDPQKYKAATELAQSLTKAYMELKKHLETPR